MKKALLLAIVLAGAGAVGMAADQYWSRFAAQDPPVNGNVEYDGRLVFVRLRYNPGAPNYWRARGSNGEPPWMHDYPTSDTHMMKILKELTLADPRTDASNVMMLDDPKLCDYPIAYMSEPGYWTMSDAEAAGLRAYLLKGGFIMFDDFRDQHWYTMEEQMRRVLPDLRWIQIGADSQIFHSFFEIDSLDLLTSYGPHKPEYWALFENNDPRKRVIALANFNNDIGEYWEFSDQGLFPVDISNEAYKFGVNYFIYGLIH
jgi:Domain of unknown function (DUF4159)